MKLKYAIAAIAVTGAAAAAPAVAPAQRIPAPTAVAAKTCSAGFKHAWINGAQKCLRRGEFCAHRYDRHAPHRYAYVHYGYRCIAQDDRGNYHLTPA
jgi:hypothetical protein